MLKKILIFLSGVIFLFCAAIGGLVFEDIQKNKPKEEVVAKEPEKPVEESKPNSKEADPKKEKTNQARGNSTGKLMHIPAYKDGADINLKIDYDVFYKNGKIQLLVKSNLPDGVELHAEITNITAVKEELGISELRPESLSKEQFDLLMSNTYTETGIDYVIDGATWFLFNPAQKGSAFDLAVTMPLLQLQSEEVREKLGNRGEKLSGNYVISVPEKGDKTIDFRSSFDIEEVSD